MCRSRSRPVSTKVREAPPAMRSRPTLRPLWVAPAVTTSESATAAFGRRHQVDGGVMRRDVRLGQHDVVVEGAADRHRPALDAPGLAHHAVAVERLEQR